MKLTFTTSLEDWMAFQKHALQTEARYRDVVFVYQWFFAAAAGAIAAYVFSDVSLGVGLGAGFVSFSMVAFLYPRAARRGTLEASRKEMSKKKLVPLFTSERTLEICEDGLRSHTVAGVQLLRCAFVDSVHETPTHAFILLPGRSGHVIPRSAVDSDALKVFLSEIRKRIEQSV
jgi:hypothetical protein